MYVLKTNLPPLETGLEVGIEYLIDVFDLVYPVDITPREELESLAGDYYEMIMKKVNADRLARGLRPLPFSRYLYRLGHKKYTRKPPIIHLNEENGFDTVDGGKRRSKYKKLRTTRKHR